MPRPPSALKSGRRPAPVPPPRALRGAAGSELSLVAAFDDLVRNGKVLNAGAEEQFVKFVKQTISWKKRFQRSDADRQRLHSLLRERENDLTAKEYKIKQARRMVEDERRGRVAAESDRDYLAQQLDMVKNLLLSDHNRGIDNETLERVRHIDTTRRNSPYKENERNNQLPVVDESCESILDVDDMSFDETGGDILGESRRVSGNKRRSSGRFEAAQKRRKSRSVGNQLEMTAPPGNSLKATTTTTVDADGVARTEAVLETVPLNLGEGVHLNQLRKAARKSRDSTGRVTYSEKKEYEPSAPPAEAFHAPVRQQHQASPATGVRRHFSNASSIPNRPHYFVNKKALVTDKCGVCLTRIKFRQTSVKCRDCGAVAHPDCRSKVPLPCVAGGNRTPSKTTGGNLADYTPSTSPMVPAILMHCVREIEARGMSEIGLYRVPGTEAVAHEILDKFLRARNGAPVLSGYDIHSIASALKKFLRSLKEPVIPLTQWKQFINAANNPDYTDGEAAMYQAVTELPRPNRDTLAFLVHHLQKVAQSPDCKMPAENLSMIMGPTVVGYSSTDPGAILTETELQKATMRLLLAMPSEYWAKFIQCEDATLLHSRYTPDRYNFAAPSTPMIPQSAIAKRTRSRLSKAPMARPQESYFQSPMLH